MNGHTAKDRESNSAGHLGNWRTETVAVAAGRPQHVAVGPVKTPISMSSTFHHFAEGDYARAGTDTTRSFEIALGALDGGIAIAFGSGMAAIAAVVESMPAGATMVMPRTLYSGAAVLLTDLGKLGKATVKEVDLTDTDAVIAALGSHADLLWCDFCSCLHLLDLLF